MIARAGFCILICLYGLLIFPFVDRMKNRQLEVKLGYMPDAQILKLASAEHKLLVAQYAVTKVLFYFGTVLQHPQTATPAKTEYFNMFKTMEKAVKLDPYNMDAYYFTQAAFTWELKRAKDVNAILVHGMKYRTWDWYLPFYAGFNSAYFLKDFDTAAKYMRKAADISGNPLFTSLAARYFHQAGHTDLGIAYLDGMIKTAKDKAVKKTFEMRKKELETVRMLSALVDRFNNEHGRMPRDLHELVVAGHLSSIPQNRYGGTYVLTPEGKIEATLPPDSSSNDSNNKVSEP